DVLPQPFEAQQQQHNIPNARYPAAYRAKKSCTGRTPNTSCTCWGTIKHAQISAILPAAKAPLLTRATRGEATSKCRRKCPANGSINNAVTARPMAANQ